MNDGYRFDGQVIDGTGAAPVADGTVIVLGDTVEWVGETAAVPEKYAAMELDHVTGEGRTIMPGLVDAHVHTSFGEARSEEELALYTPVEYRSMLAAWNVRKVLRAGVTSLSDPATTFNISACLRDAIEAGIVEGPRMAAAGRQITSRQGLEDAFPSWMEFPPGQAGVLVKSPDEIVEEIRLQVKDGVDVIKVSGSNDSAVTSGPVEGMAFTEEEFALMATETHRLGRKCTVHARTSQSVRACAAAGFDWMQHASYMDSEGLDLVLEKDIPIVPALTLLVNLLASAGDAGASSLDVFKREVDAASENLGNAFRQGATIISGSETGWSLVPFGEWHAFEMEILVTHLGLSTAGGHPRRHRRGRHHGAAMGRAPSARWSPASLPTFWCWTPIRWPTSACCSRRRRSPWSSRAAPPSIGTRRCLERREYSWEKNKIYLQGRFRYDESLKQGFVTDL